MHACILENLLSIIVLFVMDSMSPSFVQPSSNKAVRDIGSLLMCFGYIDASLNAVACKVFLHQVYPYKSIMHINNYVRFLCSRGLTVVYHIKTITKLEV